MGSTERGVLKDADHSQQNKKLSNVFLEQYPYYRSIGMSSEEYWDGDPSLTRYFSKAFKIKEQQRFNENNYRSWLQGLYIYEAVSVAISRTIGNNKDATYCDKPYDFTEKTVEEKTNEEQNKALNWMLDLEKALSNKYG